MPAQAHSQRQRSSLVPRAKSRCDSGFDFIDLFTQVLHSGKSRLDGTDSHSHAVCVGHEVDLVNRDLKTSKSRVIVATIIPSFLRHIDATIFGKPVINYGGFHIYENPVFRPVAGRPHQCGKILRTGTSRCDVANTNRISSVPYFSIPELLGYEIPAQSIPSHTLFDIPAFFQKSRRFAVHGC